MTTLVVGAGPAGCAAAMWLRDLEQPFRWIDAGDQLGGTLRRVGNQIHNYPGLIAANGVELVDHFARSLRQLNLAPEMGRRLESIRNRDGGLVCEYGEAYHAHSAVLLATGTRPRTLNVEGEERFRDLGIEISVTRNLTRYSGLPVCVIGGGDAALEGALLLAPHVPIVHLVHRCTEYRAQTRFVERIRESANIRTHGGQVKRFRGQDRLTGVELDSGERLEVEAAFIRVGVQPSVPTDVVINAHGYIDVDAEFRTSRTGVWACGDVVGRDHQSVAWAVGSAARAIRSIVSSG